MFQIPIVKIPIIPIKRIRKRDGENKTPGKLPKDMKIPIVKSHINSKPYEQKNNKI
jgi:hypothetical protein